jgi:GntR family transcriptional regulator of gluconate operon
MSKEPTNFASKLIATLKERIISWQYPPEYRLSEDALGREFGVSRSPVREALRVLATSALSDQIIAATSFGQVNVKDVEELYEVRLARAIHSRNPSHSWRSN